MSVSGLPKRHRGNRRGGTRDAGSSRDASEEDNDNASDVGSLMSVRATPGVPQTESPAPVSPKMGPPALPSSSGIIPGLPTGSMGIPPATRRALHKGRLEELSGEGSQSEGLDSPTYDGDVESTSTVGGTPIHTSHNANHTRQPSSPSQTTTSGNLLLSPEPSAQTASSYGSQRLPTPKASRANLTSSEEHDHPPYHRPRDVPVRKSTTLAEPRKSQTEPVHTPPNAGSMAPLRMLERPQELAEDDIKGFVQRAIEGRGAEDGVDRWWKTNAPPEGKVVRVYADGVYDLFHFGHALQLRQAKLSFPFVHLLVGVVSDELCADYKSAPAMTHAERCEGVRHCRWADEILPDAPWVVDQAWLEKHDIDYIAHDELVYPSKGHEDVYAFAKSQGRFVPTRRTPAISTSDLLERIVRGYRDGFFDSKLEKNGHPELVAADVDWDSSASLERRERRSREAKSRKIIQL